MKRSLTNNSATWFSPVSSVTVSILVFALLVFAAMIWVAFETGNEFDEAIFSNISHTSAGFTYFMRYVSYLGNTEFLTPANCLLVIFLVVRKENWTAVRVAVIALSSLVIMSSLKRAFHRQRPSDPFIEGISNYSFPSGHAFMSVAFYGLMICWAIHFIKNKKQKFYLITALICLLVLIGFSRIYLRMHYTSDVIAGWCMGTAWLLSSMLIMDKIESRMTQIKKIKTG